jgi:predicted unusual protein kinase regulating ubiquinone biosynthesis (AarF/ABC1/UbiB family)
MIDGFLHADPHPGNILVNAQGQLIILDFGMVIRVDEEFKRHLIRYAIAVAQQNVEGMVKELYELQLVEPGTNKALLRDLATLMLEIQHQGKLSARKVQQMTTALMNAFYEFPFTLPSELVYIGRAASLVEGIGFIHDPWFDAVEIGRPIIKELARTSLKEELEGNLLDILQEWVRRSYQTITAFQDTVIKLDREQLRLHLHPIDIQNFSTIIGRATRRILGGMFALLLGIITSMLYLRVGNALILVVGITISSLVFLLLFILPDKIPRTKQQRTLQKHVHFMATDEGEVYKSFTMSRMTAEERQQAEHHHHHASSDSDSRQ